MSVQSLYRLYRENSLIVNRRYQRKLVWTMAEKQSLISSIQKSYPIPLILLADGIQETGYEIVDGMQRLNAIFTFIENDFPLDDRFFDVKELPRAKNLAEEGIIQAHEGELLLSSSECASFLEYQLPVTIYPASSPEAVWDIFRRINSSGRHLSPHETRQAGILNDFAELVRQIASEVRGDVSRETLLLSQMPSISIDSPRSRLGYGVHADETFWCRQGILLASQLRDSEDEQLLADLLASIVLRKPLSSNRELLDDLYDEESANYKALDAALKTYSPSRAKHEILQVFSLLRSCCQAFSDNRNALRDQIRTRKSGNPMKGAFFALFMGLHELVFDEELTPESERSVLEKLSNVDSRLTTERHHTTEDDRRKNIDTIKGLIRPAFVKKESTSLGEGASLIYELENSLRRSAIETARYECKQGLLPLTEKNRELNKKLLAELPAYISAIANVGPDSAGFLFLGVADSSADSERAKAVDGIDPQVVGDRWIVGIDREAKALGIGLEDYVAKIAQAISNSALDEPLKSQVSTQLDVVNYFGLHVLRARVPAQPSPTFLGEKLFIRRGSELVEASPKEIAAVSATFSR